MKKGTFLRDGSSGAMSECESYSVTIYIAGPIDQIKQQCRKYCEKGLCVTVTPTDYIYTMGEESGAMIGLINYPRFPKDTADIYEEGVKLGEELMFKCHQGSFTIVTPTTSYFFSRRAKDQDVV